MIDFTQRKRGEFFTKIIKNSQKACICGMDTNVGDTQGTTNQNKGPAIVAITDEEYINAVNKRILGF